MYPTPHSGTGALTHICPARIQEVVYCVVHKYGPLEDCESTNPSVSLQNRFRSEYEELWETAAPHHEALVLQGKIPWHPA